MQTTFRNAQKEQSDILLKISKNKKLFNELNMKLEKINFKQKWENILSKLNHCILWIKQQICLVKCYLKYKQ